MQVNPGARTRARHLVLQGIYQWAITDNNVSDIIYGLKEQQGAHHADVAFFERLMHGVIEQHTTIDAQIDPFLDRPIVRLNPIELAVLRIATFELINEAETPFKIIINESVELAKRFGSADGYKYVNAVLDKLAKALRPEGD